MGCIRRVICVTTLLILCASSLAACADTRMTVTVVPNRAAGTIRVEWSIDPRALPQPTSQIAHYRPSLAVNGESGSLPTTTTPSITLPWSDTQTSIATELMLVVVVRFKNGASSAPFVRYWTLPAYYEVAPATRWTAASPAQLVDDGARKAAGLGVWPDGTMGFTRIGGVALGFGPNGGDSTHSAGVARWRVGATGPFANAVTATRIPITGQSADYAAGGPVYFDAPSGRLLMIYHGEEHDPGGSGFWSFLGLARSTDAGRTWTSLGPIIEPQIAPTAPGRSEHVEVGGGAYVIHQISGVDYMYVYFRDTLSSGVSHVAVARARLTDVLAAAASGSAPSFSKWHGGAWGEPGLRGASTNLLPNSPRGRWFDVVDLVDRNLYVMVHSEGFLGKWTYLVRTSTNGRDWSAPQRLPVATATGEQLYLTLSSPDPGSQRVVNGNAINMYRVRSTNDDNRWDEAVVEFIRLTYTG